MRKVRAVLLERARPTKPSTKCFGLLLASGFTVSDCYGFMDVDLKTYSDFALENLRLAVIKQYPYFNKAISSDEVLMTRRRNRWLVLLAILLAHFPVVIDATILHIAVPTLTLALGATGNEVLWIIDIYPLVMAGLLIPMGTLADRIGHRLVLLVGLAVFGIASVCAAFSPSAPFLIGARVGLALGAAMIMPCVLALVRHTFSDPRERAFALGIWSTVSCAGAAVGPLVGGALLEYFWWGSVFLINVPIMLVVLPVAYRLLPRVPIASMRGWNIGQALLLIAGLVLAVYAVKFVVKGGGSYGVMLLFLAIGISMLLWFGRLLLSAERPMLDLSLFAKPAIAVGILMAFVASGAIAGFELVLAQELQYVLGKTPLQAGLFMAPFMIMMAISGPIAGRLSGIFPLRQLASAGLALAALSLAGIASIHLAGNYYVIAFLLAVLGFALMVGLLASSIAVMGSAPVEKAGAAGALEGTGYELGAGLGITFFGVMLGAIYRQSFMNTLPDAPPQASSSIGEAVLAAQTAPNSEAIIEAAKTAFSQAHSTLLLIAAGLIGVLAIAVFVVLRNYKDPVGNGQGSAVSH